MVGAGQDQNQELKTQSESPLWIVGTRSFEPSSACGLPRSTLAGSWSKEPEPGIKLRPVTSKLNVHVQTFCSISKQEADCSASFSPNLPVLAQQVLQRLAGALGFPVVSSRKIRGLDSAVGTGAAQLHPKSRRAMLSHRGSWVPCSLPWAGYGERLHNPDH